MTVDSKYYIITLTGNTFISHWWGIRQQNNQWDDEGADDTLRLLRKCLSLADAIREKKNTHSKS